MVSISGLMITSESKIEYCSRLNSSINDSTIVSKALKKLFEEYNVKSDNSDVEAYIKSMLEGSSSN